MDGATMRYDEAEVEKFLKDLKRMCNPVNGCKFCVFNEHANGSCFNLIRNKPKLAMDLVEKWCNEHPLKTYKQDFVEKYPQCKLDSYGDPLGLCCGNIYNFDCHNTSCKGCWSQEMEV